MIPNVRGTCIALLLLSLPLVASAAELGHASVRVEDGPGLSLRIPDEVAPAGSIVQLKIEVTEPKPISTGRGKIKTAGVAQVVGIVLMNRDQDTYGVALLNDGELSFDVTSPSSLFGTPSDYPILGIAVKVQAGASSGTRFPLTLDPAGLGFRDPSGVAYPYEIDNGQLIIGSGVTIGNVSPGSSIVPAGGIVTVSGANFAPSTRIRLHEVDIAEQRFISSERIDLVLAQSANMHGMRLRARNDDDSESEYFSYQRTAASGSSNDSILKKVVPLFAPGTFTSATVSFREGRSGVRRHRAVGPSRPLGSRSTSATGFALQNLGSSSATVGIELLDASGNVYATNTMVIGPDRYVVREVGDVFGLVTPPSALRIKSNIPLQILGLVADHTAGTAAALPPR